MSAKVHGVEWHVESVPMVSRRKISILLVTVVAAGALGTAWMLGEQRPGAVAVPVPGDWALLPEGARAAVTAAIETCRAGPDDPVSFALLGRIYHGNAAPALAIAAYERALALGTPEAGTPYRLALLYEDWGRTDQALDRLRLSLDRDPGYAPAWWHLGRNLFDAGDVQGSITACRRAVELEPSSATYHTELGRALRRAGKISDAVASLRQAVALEPNHPGAHQLLGLALRARGENAEADTHLAQLRRYRTEVVRDPWLREAMQHAASVETRLAWARSYLDAGRLDSALELLRALAEAHPDRAEVFRRLGETYARSGQPDLAVQPYTRAAELEPFDVGTHNALAESLLLGHDLTAAAQEVSLALAVDPDDVDGLVIQAAILLRGGDPAQAARRLEALTARRGDHVAGHYWLGEALMAQQRYRQAARVYERLLELQPDLDSARRHLELARRELARPGRPQGP